MNSNLCKMEVKRDQQRKPKQTIYYYSFKNRDSTIIFNVQTL